MKLKKLTFCAVLTAAALVTFVLESDLLTVMRACTEGTLENTEVRFSDKHACCVILASAGYPVSYKKGFPITMTAEAAASCPTLCSMAQNTLRTHSLLPQSGFFRSSIPAKAARPPLRL